MNGNLPDITKPGQSLLAVAESETASRRRPTATAASFAAPTFAPTTPPATQSPALVLAAELKGVALEAVSVVVGDAYLRGDHKAIVEALAAQAVLLETLGTKLIRMAGLQVQLTATERYGALGLRALEQARKTLATLAGLGDKGKNQTNVQVNVGGVVPPTRTNEVMVVPHDE